MRIYHPKLGAFAEVADVSVPDWQAVGWTVAPEDAEPATVKQPKKQATRRGTAAESE